MNRQSVPPASASAEKKREAQRARSREFGIEALSGSAANLSYPSGDPTTLRLYGDPVNLKYPLGGSDNKIDLDRANNARARFKQASGTYRRVSSKRVIHNRIVRAQLSGGASPSFDQNDPLDKLLDKSIKDRLNRSVGAKRFSCKILHRQEELRVVTGIVMDPVNIDAFGNRVPDKDFIERVAFGFMERFQRVGTDHKLSSAGGTVVNPKLVVVESYIARQKHKVFGTEVPEGAWILSVKVLDDEVWDRVKRGELNGFSLEGVFVRVPIAKKKAT